MPKKKQVSLETIEFIQRTINDLLECKMEQSSKRNLCLMMEKLLKDIKQKDDDYQYLHWNRYGKLDWEADKEDQLKNITVGDTIRIPDEYRIGPDAAANDSADSFVSDIQGEWSRVYY